MLLFLLYFDQMNAALVRIKDTYSLTKHLLKYVI